MSVLAQRSEERALDSLRAGVAGTCGMLGLLVNAGT